MINVALIGYGHLGRWHVDKALSFENVNVVAVVDPAPDTSSKLKERNIDVPHVSNIDEIIDQIDAGIVVTPTSFHYDLVMKLLDKNKHVFCEKPMTSTFEQALNVKSALEKSNVIFQVGHSERFHGIWPKVLEHREYLSGESLLRFERQAAFKGRATDVDVVQDLMIHDIDLMLYLTGEKPISLKALGHKVRTNHYDFVQAEFFFKSGKKVQIISGRNYTHEVRSFETFNKNGVMRVDLLNCEFLLAPGNTTTDHVLSESYDKRDHLYIEQAEFYSAIATNSPITVGIEAGVDAIYLISKVLESLDKDYSNSEVLLGDYE